MKDTKKIAILIPAYNEEKILDESLKSLLKLTSAGDIYLADDSSGDSTKAIAKSYLKNVLSLKNNVGKAEVLNSAIKYFKLTKKYKYILPIDADTKLDENFLENVLDKFEKDKEHKIVAVVGKISGTLKSWVTAYRLWEYEIGQMIHKSAQDKEGAILVCSGCTTVYRASLFNSVFFPGDTLTEDMDLTFQIHRQNLGKIIFCKDAVAVTQDPLTLKDFIKQIDRWYSGYWQCLYKHKVPFGHQMLDFETAVASLEGLLGGLLFMALLAAGPWLTIKGHSVIWVGLLIDFLVLFIPSVLLVSIKYKTISLFKYLLQFYFLRLISSLMFIKTFFTVFINLKSENLWNKVDRYSFKGVKACIN